MRIKDVIKEKGLTINELAEKLKVSRQALSRQIQGKMLIETAEKIASALDVPIWQLFVAPDDVRSTGAMPSATGFVALIKNGSDMYSAASIQEAKDVLKRIEETQQNSPDDANQHENRTDL